MDIEFTHYSAVSETITIQFCKGGIHVDITLHITEIRKLAKILKEGFEFMNQVMGGEPHGRVLPSMPQTHEKNK